MSSSSLPLQPELGYASPNLVPTQASSNMLKLLKPSPQVGPLKPPLTEVTVVEEPLELAIIYVDFCLGRHDVVVSLVVLLNVSKQSPIVEVSNCLTKCMIG